MARNTRATELPAHGALLYYEYVGDCGESEAENEDPANMTDSKIDFLGRHQRC